MSTIPKPTVGRTVLVAVQIGEGIATLPMIVSHVHEGMCISGVLQSAFADAGVFPGGTKPMCEISYGPSGMTPNTWRWMDYQLGQAAKTNEAEKSVAEMFAPFDAALANLTKRNDENDAALAELRAQLVALNQKQPASQRVAVADPSLQVDSNIGSVGTLGGVAGPGEAPSDGSLPPAAPAADAPQG
jgi:hypothetical protein